MSDDDGGERSSHWTRRLFVDNAELYLPFLEAGIPRAEEEAALIVEQLREVGISDGARLLDAGCGIGRHSVALASRG